MITASVTQDFIPFGRDYMRQHPGQLQMKRKGRSSIPDHGVPLIRSFEEISLRETVKKENWLLRKHGQHITCDEELYVSGATVVWSRGSVDGARHVVKTFTMDTPVLQACWACFVLSSSEHTVDARSEIGAVGKRQEGVCVVESNSLSFFMEEGGEYSTPLPFQVSQTWPIKDGLLFERVLARSEVNSQTRNCPNQTVVFSLLHPLDDLSPVITRTLVSGGPPKISYLTDSNMALIFTSLQPSLAFTYDSVTGHHSAWRVREARQQEIIQLAPAWENTSFLPTATQFAGGHSLSSSCSRQLTNISAIGPDNSSSFSPIFGKVMSPSGIMRSSPGTAVTASSRAQLPGLAASATTALYRFHTPPQQCTQGRLYFAPGSAHSGSFLGNESLPTEPLTSQQPNVSLEQQWIERAQTFSRTHSPGMAVSDLYKFHTPPQQCSQGRLLLAPGSAHNGSFFGNESMSTEPVASLQPNVCMEQLWIETVQTFRDGQSGKASKAFLSKDLCGQQYLCYLVPYRQQLRCLKFEESNDGNHLIFGTITSLHAREATPIESQDLLLVLETSGVLVLFTGTVRISQVHIPVLPLGSGSLSLMRSTASPFESPVKGEVVTSSRPPSAMDVRLDEEMSHISPVPIHLDESTGQLEGSVVGCMVTPGNSFIQNLRDNVGKKFSVEMMNGSIVRAELPPMTYSPGIDLCLRSLKHLLPSDRGLQMLGRWYTCRNTPGGVGNVSEWSMFTRCLLGMMGYDIGKLKLTSPGSRDGAASPLLQSKKARPSEQGTDEDWEYVITSEHHHQSHHWQHLLGTCDLSGGSTAPSRPCSISRTALLFQFCPAVMLALHLVYEEMKLHILLQEELLALAPIVHQIACDLECDSYAESYRRDFPHLLEEVDDISQVTQDDLGKMQYPHVFPRQAPTVMGWISQALGTDRFPDTMPYIPQVCEDIKKIVKIYTVLISDDRMPDFSTEKFLKKIAPAGHRAPTTDLTVSMSRSPQHSPGYSQPERIVITMAELNVTQLYLDRLPIGISLPMREACLLCRAQPPSDWPENAYLLIGRQDLAQLASLTSHSPSCPPPASSAREKDDAEEEDGMEHLDEDVLKLRFPEDLRLQEVRRLLQSARPVTIAITQRPEVSDHDFIEEQERTLLSTCVRTLALPVGRGMFTLCTSQPLLTETQPIPKLCLTGRAPPRNTIVDLNRIDVPNNMSVWPQFHNGVAAGLRIADCTRVDSSWIIYNKPKELTNEFAGFLMALGLNGHLPNLCTFNIHEYISEGSELISVGILLGMSAARRGSMDHAVTKALSVHVSALLPPTSMELNIAHNTRVAAVLGVGLLYQGTGHLHMAEVMLSEIGRPPGPEMENCIDRESYALAAGLSLGLIMFGKGNQTTVLSDLSMADLLCHLMVGGHTQTMLWPSQDRVHQVPSFLIKEGDRVNVDVTSPGATLALGMVFFNTGNSAVSEWLRAPDTEFMLDQVRPDFLCLRTISHGLVNWNSILPSSSWIANNIPEIVKKFAFHKRQPGEDRDQDMSVDIQTMSQAHCNITSGACLVLALKFAGSANAEAHRTLLNSLNSSMELLQDQAVLDQTGRSTVETCVSVKLLALAIVMAGTGDLATLRICRALRRRVGAQHHQFTYGNHMCVAMATGLLFLGGGKFTLRTTPDAIGAMVCAFYPQFPLTSTDNKYHLQACRHLYVLACEPRLFIPRDVDTARFCLVPLSIKYKACPSYKSVSFNAAAPYITPELEKLEEIHVLGPRYWPISFQVDKNWDILKILLQKGGVLPVKQRAGHMTYTEDPKGYRSALSKSLVADTSCHYTSQLDVIKSFTSDAKIIALAECFVGRDQLDNAVVQELSSIIHQCVTQEKAEAIYSHFILKHVKFCVNFLIHMSFKGN